MIENKMFRMMKENQIEAIHQNIVKDLKIFLLKSSKINKKKINIQNFPNRL